MLVETDIAVMRVLHLVHLLAWVGTGFLRETGNPKLHRRPYTRSSVCTSTELLKRSNLCLKELKILILIAKESLK